MNKLPIPRNTLFNFILLLGVIDPIVENNDTVFYISCALTFIAVLALTVPAIYKFKKNRKQFLLSLIGGENGSDDFFTIAIAGLLVDYSLGRQTEAIFWWIVIAACVVEFILSMRNKHIGKDGTGHGQIINGIASH